MNESFIKNIRVLKKAIAERKLVVFAGAGVSIDSGVPSWGNLIDELRNEIDIPENENDFLRIAQMYYNERQQKELIDKIREVLKHKKLRYNEIHEAIFELNPEHIITTNFDDLFEQVIKAKAHPFSVIKKDSEFPYGHNTKLLVKIHGDLDEANLVFKEDDYLEYSKTHPLIESFIKGIFANKVVLFVGYSFSDINLKIILQSVRSILGHDFQNAYMLAMEEGFHPAKRQYLKNKGINIINYNDAGTLFDMNAIEQYLFVGRNALHYEFAKRNTNLSPKGANLLYLIKFITKYLDFAESLVKDDPVTQMYKSLNRFTEVRVLPPTFLGNLFPFNNHKRHIHNYHDYTLGSNNKAITTFFFEDFDNESNTLKDSYFEKNKIPIHRKEELEKKLHDIIQKLNFSSILFFGKSDHQIELFDSPKELPHKIKLSLPNRCCECLSCLFNDLRIKDFLKKLKEETITETSEIQSDLLLAYSNYKAGNFKTSYTQFEEIANKAWQLGKYISYYIAKQNIKHLRNLVSWQDDEINQEKSETIVEKIDDLDLDKLLLQMPTLDDDEYKLLKKIKDDEILLDAEGEISEYYDKILSVYEQYKNGGYSHGPYYPSIIAEELYRAFFFYTYNYLIKDAYYNFRRVIQKGIKAFLICYSIDENYPQRLRSFDFWILRLIILYGNEDSVLKTFNKYKIKELNVDKESLPKAIQFLNNLFQSVFTETNFLGRNISLDRNLLSQTKNFHFQDNFRVITHNTLLVFAGIKLPDDHAQVVIRNFFDFLRTQNILVRYSEKYLNKFLVNIKDHFRFDDFIEILKISVETDADYGNDFFFEVIGFGIKEKYPDRKIEDEDLIKSIIIKHINPKQHKHEKGLMYLWKVCDDKNKLIIEEALNQELASTFDEFAYLHLCFENIFPPSKFYENYIRELERHIPKDVEWKNGKPHHFSYTFHNFVNLIYGKDVLSEQIPYTKWDEYPEFWKFYLRPLSYDYSKFDAKWLLVVNTESVHEKLKSISEIRIALSNCLKTEYNEELSKIYTQFYL